MMLRKLALVALSALTATPVLAGVPTDLPLPKGAPSADQIIEQGLCCTNQSEGAIPLTPDGLMPRARFEAFRAE